MPISEAAFAKARRHMVESQLLPNRVTERRLVDAMSTLPRERFVPTPYRGVAYMDDDVAIAPGRYLMEPMVFARLLQEADLEPSDLVLDIGCGTGYSTAVLARLSMTVVGLESDPALVQAATETLSQLGIDNAAIVQGNLEAGLPEQGPFNAIVLGGAIDRLPDALTSQLAEGGRMLAVIREDGIGRATLIRRIGRNLARRVLFDAGIGSLPGFKREPAFVF